MTDFLEVLLRGLGVGSVYALLALGFVIIYKATGVISFAQPALMLTGAVVTSYVAPAIGFMLFTGLTFFVSLGAAALITAVIALIVERLAIRPMIGRPAFVVAIITIGLDIAIRVVASGFIGLGARPIPNPWGLQRTELLGLRVQERHLVSMLALAVIVAALVWFYRYTRYGLAMRAAAFDQEAALTQGVSVGSVFAMSWAMAGALAAIAGTLLATSAGVDRQLWIVALVALPAIILGGLDSLEGAVIGGLAVGVVESMVGSYQRDLAPWLGNNFAGVSPYVLMLLVLLAKPYGIFGTPEVRRV
ncbi:branched-chain amino acid ABC transporter permease [Nocardioides donggukensis]|uniref:Branched-chain amino acid ABC transporter permease n=1 Tax=Nocardioides donggukensis TaxID=2774019 RepID=A0A927K1D6_9ACTN|nr:branched-chain amino acid ABC transporter permease [Nocardioides donggukensis]MBD8868422.1 branched-chain amino acid ABC transporter permease [Nocardioides donggukensis]